MKFKKAAALAVASLSSVGMFATVAPAPAANAAVMSYKTRNLSSAYLTSMGGHCRGGSFRKLHQVAIRSFANSNLILAYRVDFTNGKVLCSTIVNNLTTPQYLQIGIFDGDKEARKYGRTSTYIGPVEMAKSGGDTYVSGVTYVVNGTTHTSTGVATWHTTF